jgi:hypothetical protein
MDLLLKFFMRFIFCVKDPDKSGTAGFPAFKRNPEFPPCSLQLVACSL